LKTEQPEQLPRATHYVAACPYCRHVNRGFLSAEVQKSLGAHGSTADRKLVNCDVEEGGCDREFFVNARAVAVFTVETFPIRGLYPDADADSDDAPDLRVWTLRTRAADEPGDSTHSFNAAELQARAPSSPLYALALTMRGDDKLHFTSSEGLVSYDFECFEPEESDRFCSFVLARREARRRAINSGAPVEIYFDGENAFRLYRTNPFPVPAPPADFEHVATVEAPVVFRIMLDRQQAGEGRVSAEVHCDDLRANSDLQKRFDSDEVERTLIFYADSAPDNEAGIRETVEHAAAWIRSEFPTLDAEIEAPISLEEDADVPADFVTDDRRVEDRD
jgi:hypothetical protein